MIILSDTGGQTCNKFFQYLYYLNDSVLRGEKLRIQLPDISIEDYPNLLKNRYISFPFYSHRLTKLIGIKKSLYVTRLFTVLFLNNYFRCLFHQLSFRKIDFVSGKPTWIGTNTTYENLRPILKKLFLLRDDLKAEVDTHMTKDNGEIICGIHMRGGDYRTWLNGKYFYEQRTYRKAADNFKGLFPQIKIKFLICSNEPLEEKVWEGIDYIQIPAAKASQDIYALTECDYIIGTLSSFNAWASLLGNVPLFTLLDKDDATKLTLDMFSPVVNYEKKENGWEFPRKKSFYHKLPHPWLYRHSNKEYLLDL